MYVVELEHEDGHRFWSRAMREDEVNAYIAAFARLGYGVSDVDTASETAV